MFSVWPLKREFNTVGSRAQHTGTGIGYGLLVWPMMPRVRIIGSLSVYFHPNHIDNLIVVGLFLSTGSDLAFVALCEFLVIEISEFSSKKQYVIITTHICNE